MWPFRKKKDTISNMREAIAVPVGVEMPRMYLHVYVDESIESIVSATKEGHFVAPFYTGDVEGVPDFSGVDDMRVHKPFYVGNFDDPHGAIRDIVKGLSVCSFGVPLFIEWPEGMK